MAITFAQQKRKQQYLLLALAGVALLTLIVIWTGFFKTEPSASPAVFLPAKPPEVKIDLTTLKSLAVQGLDSFPQLPPFYVDATAGAVLGRTNPFIPYGGRQK